MPCKTDKTMQGQAHFAVAGMIVHFLIWRFCKLPKSGTPPGFAPSSLSREASACTTLKLTLAYAHLGSL
jgi:hypothetical protein